MTNEKPHEPDQSPARILVVDDILNNRRVLCHMLTSAGYEVDSVPNGKEALNFVESERPDLILLDVNMPEMDGFEVCRRLKAEAITREIPVLFITARTDTQSMMEGFKEGGVDYVAKPIQIQEILARVATHLKVSQLMESLRHQNERLEREMVRRKEAEEAARQANETKSQFLSFITHEMRSPLTSVLGFLDLVREDVGDQASSECLDSLTRIRSSGEFLLKLVNNLLDLAKVEAGRMPVVLEDFDPVTWVWDLAKDAEPLVTRNGNQLHLVTDSAPKTVRGDATKIKEVVLNLLSNAAKFTKDGRIELKVEEVGQADVQYLQMQVKDTGIGMTAEQIRLVFEPYVQATASTGRRYGGTGLGLAICKKLCRLMSGDLSVESKVGQGTTFTVQLPVCAQVADPATAQAGEPLITANKR